MRILLVVNPFASSVTPRGRVVIQRALRSGHDLQVVETTRRGQATRFAQDAATRGIDVVAVLGGDGTVNEAANGLVGTGTSLAPLPGGSTNVFARSLGYPNDPVAASRTLAAALLVGSTRRAGLGIVNGRYFCFHTGIGFDASIVRSVEQRATVKRWAGHVLFAAAGLSTWWRSDRRSPTFAVRHGDGSTVDGAAFAIVLNTDPYTYLGNRPFHVTDAARLDRGLTVVAMRDLRASTLLGAMSGALTGRGLHTTSRISVVSDLDRAVIAGHPAVPYQMDGDDLGDSERLVFRHAPDAISLVVPPT